MTLRSRRNRQTIVRNTPKGSLRRNILLNRPTTHRQVASVAIIGVAVVTLFAVLASTTAAEATYRERSIRQATGKNGSKLKWLPYRPSARSIRVAEQRTHQVRWASYQSGSSESQYDPGVTTPQPPAPAAQPTKEVDEHKWSLPEYKPSQPRSTEPTSKPAAEKYTPRYTPSYTPRYTPPSDEVDRIREGQEKYKDYGTPTVQEERKESLFKHYNDCPSEHDFKPIDELTDKVAAGEGDYPKECKLPWREYEPRKWNDTLFTWKASGLCHNPLYFEDVQLERYGHSWGPYIQPIISQAHFFVTVPFLPYKMGLNPPRECIYSLGYYRPGNCAPYMIDPLPLSVRAGLIQTATVLGAVYLLP